MIKLFGSLLVYPLLSLYRFMERGKGRDKTFNDSRVLSMETFKWAAYGLSVHRSFSENRSNPVRKMIVAVVGSGVDINHRFHLAKF